MILTIDSTIELAYNFGYDISKVEAKELMEWLDGEEVSEENLIYFLEV